jgi:hypothetical protein
VPDEIRRVEFYRDAADRSDVERELARLGRVDDRAYRAVIGKIDLLRKLPLQQAFATRIVKKATSEIFVLRVQSGPVSYRLPFFEAPDEHRTLVILTHCVHRSLLRGDRYKRLLDDAEKRRADWIRRYNKGGAR